MFVCEKHRSFSIGDALKMQAKNECHVCEISTLRAQLEEARGEVERITEMADRQYEDYTETQDSHWAALAEIERLKNAEKSLLDDVEVLWNAMVANGKRSRAWKRCAKRWRGIIRMWPKGLVSAPELEIKLETLSELNPRPESKSEPE
jgi:hypothetical protein